jgi:glycosyltransferase involved in cell wall biosynthesis
MPRLPLEYHIPEELAREIRSVYLVYRLNGGELCDQALLDFRIDFREGADALFPGCWIVAEFEYPEDCVIDYRYRVETAAGESHILDWVFTAGYENYTSLLMRNYAVRNETPGADDVENPLLTVLIPVYNNRKFLAYAVESILLQDFSSMELLVINDGSIEDLDPVMESYRNVRNIRYIKLDRNRKVSFVRNMAYRMARGKYVACLDSDDMYLPGYISHAVSILENDAGCDAVFAQYFDCTPDERIISQNAISCPHCVRLDMMDCVTEKKWREHWRYTDPRCPRCGGSGNVETLEFSYSLLEEDCFLIHSTGVLRKSVYDTSHGYDIDLTTAEDWDFWLRSLSDGKVRISDRTGVIKRAHGNGIWDTLRKQKDYDPDALRAKVHDKHFLKQIRMPVSPAAYALDPFLKDRRALVYPFNHLTHELLAVGVNPGFSISGIADFSLEQNGDSGQIIYGKPNGIMLTSDETDIDRLLSDSDALVLLDAPDTSSCLLDYFTRRQIHNSWHRLLSAAAKAGKDIWSIHRFLDDPACAAVYSPMLREGNCRLYSPRTDFGHYAASYLSAQEYEYDYPDYLPKIVGIIGETDENEGLLAAIRIAENLKKAGKKCRILTAEPHGELLGAVSYANCVLDSYRFRKRIRGFLMECACEGADIVLIDGIRPNPTFDPILSAVYPRRPDLLLAECGPGEGVSDLRERIVPFADQADRFGFIPRTWEHPRYQKYDRSIFDANRFPSGTSEVEPDWIRIDPDQPDGILALWS